MTHISDCNNTDFYDTSYFDRLASQSRGSIRFLEQAPVYTPLRNELIETWRMTLRKLKYFQREIAKHEGEVPEQLEIFYGALLPRVVSYQVRLGGLVLKESGCDHKYLHRWKAIWTNFEVD